MNSSNITSSLVKQAACIHTLSSVCVKRQYVLSSADAALYGKRFATSSVMHSSSMDTSTIDNNNLDNRRVNSSPGSDSKRLRGDPKISELPEEPTDCCMSGCANCVWIQYAEELRSKFFTSDKDARDIILSKISDTNMKMFLSMELDNLSDECKWRPEKDNVT